MKRIAEALNYKLNGEWFHVLVSERYEYNEMLKKATEEELREAEFDQQIVLSAFRFKNLEPDFIREVVESNKGIKTQLEHELIMDIHRYSVHASTFYQNAFIYLQLNLAEQKELKCYSDKVGQMYMSQLQRENESRQTYSLLDHNGMIQDQIIF